MTHRDETVREMSKLLGGRIGDDVLVALGEAYDQLHEAWEQRTGTPMTITSPDDVALSILVGIARDSIEQHLAKVAAVR